MKKHFALVRAALNFNIKACLLAAFIFSAAASSYAEPAKNKPAAQPAKKTPPAQTVKKAPAAQPFGRTFSEGVTKERVFALTFDDGPSGFTKTVLWLLKTHKQHATFFLVGEFLKDSERLALALREKDEDHLIASHTFNHKYYALTDKHIPGWSTKSAAEKKIIVAQLRQELVKDIAKTEKLMREKTGVVPVFLRMPGGADEEYIRDVAKQTGNILVNWGTCRDEVEEQVSDEVRVNSYVKALKPGAIFLMHDCGSDAKMAIDITILKGVLSAADGVIDGKKDGPKYKSVTIDKLLGINVDVAVAAKKKLKAYQDVLAATDVNEPEGDSIAQKLDLDDDDMGNYCLLHDSHTDITVIDGAKLRRDIERDYLRGTDLGVASANQAI